MIVAVDIETKGLDCTKYVSGCLIKEDKKKPEVYHKKEELWNRILELGRKQKKRGKMLNVYSHNATYDFYGYADLTDKNIKYFSHKPFIVSYNEDNQQPNNFWKAKKNTTTNPPIVTEVFYVFVC